MSKDEWGDMLNKALAPYPDLDAADRNWVQFESAGNYHSHFGPLAGILLDSRDFELSPFAYQVWEIGGWRTDGTPSMILRANQSTLEGALGYMTKHRILVYNREADLKGGVAS